MPSNSCWVWVSRNAPRYPNAIHPDLSVFSLFSVHVNYTLLLSHVQVTDHNPCAGLHGHSCLHSVYLCVFLCLSVCFSVCLSVYLPPPFSLTCNWLTTTLVLVYMAITLITEVSLASEKWRALWLHANFRSKASEDIVSKSCWAWRNITLERGWSPISSLDILIRRAPFWPADMHTVHARERREGLKPVTQQVWSVWLVQTPGRLIAHTQHDFDTISSEVFLFSPLFVSQEKPLLSGYMAMIVVILLNILIAQLSTTYEDARKIACPQCDVYCMRITTRLESSRSESFISTFYV